MSSKPVHVEEVMQTYSILPQLSPLSQCYMLLFSLNSMHVRSSIQMCSIPKCSSEYFRNIILFFALHILLKLFPS